VLVFSDRVFVSANLDEIGLGRTKITSQLAAEPDRRENVCVVSSLLRGPFSVSSSADLLDVATPFFPSSRRDLAVHGQCCWSGKPEVRSGVLRGQLLAGIHNGVAYTYRRTEYWINGTPFRTERGGIFLFPTSAVAVAWGHHGPVATLRLVVTS
jgi:hypothetical protein